MKISRSLLRALNVRRDEWWLVQKLFLLQFFQGAGIAFFFTASFSRFLEHYPVSDLAYVFIISSILLWAAGFFYGKLEHRVSSSRLSVIITIVLAASMILFRAGAAYITDDWFFFVMLAWFNVLYLLNNLMFWGMASQLYDVRQSKRLFGVISAGDIPAKFIGYSVAVLIVAITGTANLLLVGFLCIGLSFPFLKKVLQAEKSTKGHHADSSKHGPVLNTIVKDFTANILIRRVAVLSLIVSACIVLINFGFYSEVKHAYKNDVEFARFIAFFLAIARLIALLIKILVTSRLLYWLGNRAALVITPLLLIILITALLLTNVLTYNTKMVLYIFGLSAIVVDVLNSAINSPVLLTLMQPLSTLERLRAHNIVKGIMDPFAYLFSGLFLLVFMKLKIFDLQTLSYVLLGLAVAWIMGIFRVHQQYLKTLIKTISSRYFSQEEFNLYDPAARELIEEKINTGTELEVLYILRTLGSRSGTESNRLIIHALHHPSVTVVSEALRLVSELHIKEAESWLSAIIENHPADIIRGEAIKVLAEIAFQDAIIVPLMQSPDALIRNSSIISILNHSQVSLNIEDAEKRIKEFLVSADPAEKKEALIMLCETGKGHFDNELVSLLNDPDPILRINAIKAMGYHPSQVCLEQLIKKIDDHEKDVIEALIIAREKSLPYLKSRILENKCPAKQKENLLHATGRIGGKAAHEILMALISELPGFESYIIKVLHRCHFKSDKTNQPFVESLIRFQLINAATILHMQKKIVTQKEKYAVLSGALDLELQEIRETLLFLFSFIYDRDKISKIKAAIEINKKETNANAIELVDMTVKKEFANPFNAAFEFGDLEHRCDLLKSLFPKDIFPDINAILTDILSDTKTSYNIWTKSCSLYFTKKLNHKVEAPLIHKYLQSENPLLKETAVFAASIN
ncbi:MAG: hypothetical protein WBB06_01575 [Chitinophagaceae bacterium]